MKKITVSFVVDDTYYISTDRLRWLKDAMIQQGMDKVVEHAINVVQINATVGTVRKVTSK